MTPSRLTLAVAATVVAFGCTQYRTIQRVDPSSFTVQIICADDSIGTTCPPVVPGAATCPAYAGPAPSLGTPANPVSNQQRHYIIQVQAMSNNGGTYSGYNSGQTCAPGPGVSCAGVYVQYQGSASPTRLPQSDVPPGGVQGYPLQLDTGTAANAGPYYLQFTNGQACASVTIPPAFSQTALWVEDLNLAYYTDSTKTNRTVSGTHALGASTAIWRPAPVVYDLQYTTDPVYTQSPLTNKYVQIPGGTNGAPLVVTSVAAQYFTVTDTGQAGEDHAWGSTDVYTYSFPTGLNVGAQLVNLAGSDSPFDGLTELSFPTYTVVNANPDPNVPLPTPHEIKGADIPQTLTRMKPWESAIVVLKSPSGLSPGWQVCTLTGSNLSSYEKYQEWVVQPPPPPGCAPGDTSQQCFVDCSNWTQSIEVVSNQSVPSFNPMANAGKKFCALTGVLTHVVPAAGVQLWVVNVRSLQDLGDPVDQSAPCP